MNAGLAIQYAVDLRRYLQYRQVLLVPEIDDVLAEVNHFTAAVIQHGFRPAVTQLLNDPNVRFERPFIEVCDAIVEHHLRNIGAETDRGIAGKSLSEAYLHFAGTQFAFEPSNKTRLSRTLRRHGVKGFAELFLSLHLYNVISIEIQDRVAASISDLQTFEIYMLSMEAICRDIVTHAFRNPGAELNRQWSAEVRRYIEDQLLTRPE